MTSYWLHGNKLPDFPSLQGEYKTDVLIIGGGLCGILCAYEIKKLGADYMLLEAEKICRKTSGNTTAKITSQHGLIYKDIIKKYGCEAAEKYYLLNQKAIAEYEKLSHEADFDFTHKDNYIYSLDSKKKLSEEMNALMKIKAKAEFCSSLSTLPFKVKGAVKFSSQAQFNPIKFISHISKGLNIYENSRILGFDGKYYYGRNFRIKAEKVIVATHFPIFNKHGGFPLKLYQHRSYVTMLENAPQLDGMYLDENEKGLSFRNYKSFLLVGGASHRTGKKGENPLNLSLTASELYPESREVCFWAAQDCMSLDGMPYIGQYSEKTPGLFVATGFNKWGMTLSMVAAHLLKDMICGKKSEGSDIFSPSRTLLHPQLLVNGLEATASFITPTPHRCPHLGCALKKNKHENSWDCACHGSRFDINGKLLEGPANSDISQ